MVSARSAPKIDPPYPFASAFAASQNASGSSSIEACTLGGLRCCLRLVVRSAQALVVRLVVLSALPQRNGVVHLFGLDHQSIGFALTAQRVGPGESPGSLIRSN